VSRGLCGNERDSVCLHMIGMTQNPSSTPPKSISLNDVEVNRDYVLQMC